MRTFGKDKLSPAIRSGGANHVQPVGTRDLNGRNPRAAARAVNQHRISTARMSDLEKRSEGGRVRHVHRRTLRKRNVSGKRKNRPFLAERLLSIRSGEAAREIDSIAR